MADENDRKRALVPVPNPWDYRAHLVGEIACWQPPLTSADNDIRPGFDVNRARSREMALTTPHGVNSAETVRDAVVGRKFSLALTPEPEYLGVSEDEADEWATIAEAWWRRYAEGLTFDADATRKATFTQLCHIVQEGLHVDGEALGLVRAKEGALGLMTCLQLIEPERLDSKNQQWLRQAADEIRDGVERDMFGEPIAYHIRDAHPKDVRWARPGSADKVRRVTRYTDDGRPQVLHIFDEFRPSMTRGVSRGMLAALKQLKMFSTFNDATLSKAITAANYAAVIHSDLDYESAMAVLGAGGGETYGNNLTAAAAAHLSQAAEYHRAAGITFNGAKVLHLMPNEKLQVVQGNQDGIQIDAFSTMFIRQLSASLNVSYEELSRDFSQVSYSSARQSMILLWRRYLRMRELLVTKFAMPFVSCWMQEAILTKQLPMLGKFKADEAGWYLARHGLCQGGFVSWGQPMIDSVKEMTGKGLGLAFGLETLRDAAAEAGEDWGAILRQRARESRERQRLGLNPFEFDPTLVVGGGGTGQKGGDRKSGNPEEGRKARKK
ncbi:phage portal protein [uncultured Hyphomicrobium sp.]|uniref:phage portal protein n=1 Tax=uncultured Hyphomicrobium sp. TaxID=194373 RepID=UPI0025EEE27B|nr:phage portal protein [uncultured Hyphomicrobium sp.]